VFLKLVIAITNTISDYALRSLPPPLPPFICSSSSTFQVSNALDIKTWIAIILLPIILLSFIRDLRTLVPFSIVANILCLVALVIMFQYIVRNIHDVDRLPAFKGWMNLPVFFAMAVYAFEGIAVVCMIYLVFKFLPRSDVSLFLLPCFYQ